MKHRIEAHITICFCSYKVYKELERQLKLKESKLSPEKAIEIAKTIYQITIQTNRSKTKYKRLYISKKEQEEIVKLFDLKFRVSQRGKQERKEITGYSQTNLFSWSFSLLNELLPSIPSAKQMEENGGIKIGEMQLLLLKKVEELTLYILQIEKENEELKERLCRLEGQD